MANICLMDNTKQTLTMADVCVPTSLLSAKRCFEEANHMLNDRFTNNGLQIQLNFAIGSIRDRYLRESIVVILIRQYYVPYNKETEEILKKNHIGFG